MKRTMMLITVLSGFILLASCGGPSYGGYSYRDFTRVDTWEAFTEIGQDSYELVYMYDQDTFGCESQGTQLINEELFVFAKEGDHAFDMHVFSFREISGERPINVASRGPKLMVVKNGQIEDRFYGAVPIMNFIEAYRNDDYWMPLTRGTLEEDTQTFGAYAYSDFDHLDNWDDIRDMAWDEPNIVYVYGRDDSGTSEASAAINETVLSFGSDINNEVPFFVANLYDMIGVRSDDMLFSEPALLILANEQIKEAFYGQEDILAFLENADSIDFESYMD